MPVENISTYGMEVTFGIHDGASGRGLRAMPPEAR